MSNRIQHDGLAVGVMPRQLAAGVMGLPRQLVKGIESLSGHDLSDVKVHTNSPKPSQVGAHAYAQGNEIHVAPGQEKHLPHEAWHVVQQRQGRVQPTTSVNGVAVNDNPTLEHEADRMGSRAAQAGQAAPAGKPAQCAGLRREAQVMGTVLTQMMMANR